MRGILLFFTAVILLTACTSMLTSPSTMPAKTRLTTSVVIVTPTKQPAITPSPTITNRPPTPSNTPTATLSPEDYPQLADVVLEVADLSLEDGTYFSEIFTEMKPIITDLTGALVSEKKCDLDCSWRHWAVTRMSISIKLFRTKGVDDAKNLSQDHLKKAKISYGYFDGYLEQYRCKTPVPTDRTWLMRMNWGIIT